MSYSNQMLKVEDKLKKTGLTENTAVQYVKRLVRLNEKKPFKSLTFVRKVDKIMKYMNDENFSASSKESYVAMIISILNRMPTKANKVAKEKYEKILNDPSEYFEKKDRTIKTQKQKDNWIEKEEVDKVVEETKSKVDSLFNMKKVNEKQYNHILDYFVLSLYTLLPPRRNTDYLKMDLDDDKPFGWNSIITKKREMIFKRYKTSKTFGEQTISYEDNVPFIKILNLYLKHRPKGSPELLKKYDGTPFNQSNQITRILNRLFGKAIGSSMLRHIYLTDKYKDINEDMIKDSHDMAHSIDTQQKQYVKTN